MSVTASAFSRNFVSGLPFFRVEQLKLQGAPEVQRKTEEVIRAVRDLELQRDDSKVRKTGQLDR